MYTFVDKKKTKKTTSPFPPLREFNMFDLDEDFFRNQFIGFENLLKTASQTAKSSKYPPYNIKKIEDNRYCVELAVAGFGKTSLDVELEGDKLRISGNINSSSAEEDNYIYKGVGLRNFKHEFTVADNIEVEKCELVNGMLKVWLEAIIPESQKPKKIEIAEESDD